MPLERSLLVALCVASVGIGTTAAVTRPFLFRLGQEGTPTASPGVTYRGTYRSGRWVARTAPRDWSRFRGRGPGGAK